MNSDVGKIDLCIFTSIKLQGYRIMDLCVCCCFSRCFRNIVTLIGMNVQVEKALSLTARTKDFSCIVKLF